MLAISVQALEPPQWWKDVHNYNPDKSWYQYMTYTSGFFGPKPTMAEFQKSIRPKFPPMFSGVTVTRRKAFLPDWFMRPYLAN